MIDGNPWFVAVDVCRCLGLNLDSGAYELLKPLREQERWVLSKRKALEHPKLDLGSVSLLYPASTATVSLISESGLYKLIMRSDKPIAATFQDTTASN